MGNLREKMEAGLEKMLEDYENGYGLPVVLIAPDGTKQEYSANDPDTPRTILLAGRVTYARFEQDPATGMPYRVDNPIVTLRRSSLDRVPVAGEKWIVQIPEEPKVDADKKSFLMEHAPRTGGSYQWIQLPLTDLEQNSP